MSQSVETFIKRIERLLVGVPTSDSEQVQRLVAMMPQIWAILLEHPRAARAANAVLLQVVRDPLYSLNQDTDLMLLSFVFSKLRPVLERRFPAAFAEIDRAVQREKGFPPPPAHPRQEEAWA